MQYGRPCPALMLKTRQDFVLCSTAMNRQDAPADSGARIEDVFIVQDHVRRAVRRAQLTESGVHRLRHTFCSHLAMRGTGEGHPGTGRQSGPGDDTALHALEPGGARCRHPVTETGTEFRGEIMEAAGKST